MALSMMWLVVLLLLPAFRAAELLEEEYDYIVVGAGVAGGVLATRLAQLVKEAGETVLVVETGSDESKNPLLQPTFFFKDTKHTHLYRDYYSQEGPQLNNRRLLHMSPKALGGGSAINAMVWTWGDRRDWEIWTNVTGLAEWTFDDVKGYYKRIEAYEALDPTGLRGRNGPVHVSVYEPNEISRAAVTAAAKTFGVPEIADHNGDIHEGSAILQRNVRGNQPLTAERQSSWVSFLQPGNATLDNLRVLEGATVTKVSLEDKEATGIELLLRGNCFYVSARKEVILSAGGQNSPKLMLLSGLGDEDELMDVGVTPVAHLPGVGKDMLDHINPGSLIFAGPPRQDYDGNLVAAYGRTGVEEPALTPDVEFGYIMGPADLNPASWEYVPSLHMFYVLMLNNDAKGSIKLFDADPLSDPVLESGYLKSSRDAQRVCIIIRTLFLWAARMNDVLPLSQVMSGPYPLPITPQSTDDEILEVVRTTVDTHWHIANTCRMGDVRDPKSVVDAHFRVHGIRNLRIVDASVMPSVPNGHPMATIMVLAERAAEWIALSQ